MEWFFFVVKGGMFLVRIFGVRERVMWIFVLIFVIMVVFVVNLVFNCVVIVDGGMDVVVFGVLWLLVGVVMFVVLVVW